MSWCLTPSLEAPLDRRVNTPRADPAYPGHEYTDCGCAGPGRWNLSPFTAGPGSDACQAGAASPGRAFPLRRAGPAKRVLPFVLDVRAFGPNGRAAGFTFLLQTPGTAGLHDRQRCRSPAAQVEGHRVNAVGAPRQRAWSDRGRTRGDADPSHATSCLVSPPP